MNLIVSLSVAKADLPDVMFRQARHDKQAVSLSLEYTNNSILSAELVDG